MLENLKFNKETNKYICPHCGKEYAKNGIGSHIWRKHTEEGQKFDPNKGYQKGTRKGWNKGLTKETDERVRKSGETFRKRLENGEIENWWLNRKHSNETKKKISESMKIAHKERRAHNIGECRWKCEPSYPEKFFIDVIKNEFQDQNYIREYYFLGYSLDFAWVDKKLEIEIDGEQHEKIENQIHDQQRDQILKENGWKTLRIKWKDMFNNPKEYIKIAYDFIHNVS
jgi:very-short-patch-repair endonuclease